MLLKMYSPETVSWIFFSGRGQHPIPSSPHRQLVTRVSLHRKLIYTSLLVFLSDIVRGNAFDPPEHDDTTLLYVFTSFRENDPYHRNSHSPFRFNVKNRVYSRVTRRTEFAFT